MNYDLPVVMYQKKSILDFELRRRDYVLYEKLWHTDVYIHSEDVNKPFNIQRAYLLRWDENSEYATAEKANI